MYNKKSIATYFVLVTVLSAVVEALYCLGVSDYLVALLMWIPALSCLIASIVNIVTNKEKFSLKKLFSLASFKKAKLKYLLMGVLIPFVYLYIPYRIYWCMYPNNYDYSSVSLWLVLKDCLVYTIVSVLMSMLTATGEEIGWRGFLVPALNEKLGSKKTILIVGLYWCIWHFPLMIWGGYMQGTSLWYGLISFVLCIFPVSVIAYVLRMESGSLWPCALLHAAHNAYDQSVFSLLTRGENMMYFVSETGIFTILCASIIAIIMYVRYRKKETYEKQ